MGHHNSFDDEHFQGVYTGCFFYEQTKMMRIFNSYVFPYLSPARATLNTLRTTFPPAMHAHGRVSILCNFIGEKRNRARSDDFESRERFPTNSAHDRRSHHGVTRERSGPLKSLYPIIKPNRNVSPVIDGNYR